MSASHPIRRRATSPARSVALVLALCALLPWPARVASAEPGEAARRAGATESAGRAPNERGVPLHIAVASNFARPLQKLVAAFEAETGIRVRTSSGSTGSLYAQIRNGAPYDVFLAADAWRPQLLAEADLVVPGTRQTYAVGRLVLAASAGPRGEAAPGDCERIYRSPSIARIAIANPRTAPYGRAARETLEFAGDWQGVQDKLVFGANISQTFQFLATRNVAAAFVSASQLPADPESLRATCFWEVPADRHAPIVQQIVRLRRASNPAAAERFERFLTSEATRSRIEALGYRNPALSD